MRRTRDVVNACAVAAGVRLCSPRCDRAGCEPCRDGEKIEAVISSALLAAREEERELCAKACEELAIGYSATWAKGMKMCAAQIRARK